MEGLVLIAILALYFLPTIICVARKPKAANGIEIVNLFLGWTFIGWVVALAWASCGEVEPPVVSSDSLSYDPRLWKVTRVDR